LEWATYEENNNMPNHGKRISISNGMPCRCVETGEIYYSAKEAEKQTGIAANNIGRACKKATRTAGGYHWERV
jgi:hypothetical protein